MPYKSLRIERAGSNSLGYYLSTHALYRIHDERAALFDIPAPLCLPHGPRPDVSVSKGPKLIEGFLKTYIAFKRGCVLKPSFVSVYTKTLTFFQVPTFTCRIFACLLSKDGNLQN